MQEKIDKVAFDAGSQNYSIKQFIAHWSFLVYLKFIFLLKLNEFVTRLGIFFTKAHAAVQF